MRPRINQIAEGAGCARPSGAGSGVREIEARDGLASNQRRADQSFVRRRRFQRGRGLRPDTDRNDGVTGPYRGVPHRAAVSIRPRTCLLKRAEQIGSKLGAVDQ